MDSLQVLEARGALAEGGQDLPVKRLCQASLMVLHYNSSNKHENRYEEGARQVVARIL